MTQKEQKLRKRTKNKKRKGRENMAIILNRTVQLDAPISVESLHGVVFSKENKGHKFVITGIRGGELQTFTGSVIARFLRANNTTIRMGEGAEGELAACATIKDGKVVVSLARDCYNVPGRFQLTVFVTNEGETSCVYAAVGTVQRSEEGTIIDDGVALPSVDELQSMLNEIQQYETNIATAGAAQIAAVQAKGEETLDSIPDDYTALQGEVADLKSAFANYPDGVNAVVGAKPLVFNNAGYYSTVDAGSPVTFTASPNYVSCYVPTTEGDVITLDATGGTSTQRLYVWLDSSGNAIYASGKPAVNLSGKRTLTTPAGAVALAINNKIAVQASGYYAYIGSDVNTRLLAKQDVLSFDVAPTENSTNPVTSGGVFSANADTADRVQNMIPPNVIAYWPDAKSSVTGSSGALTGVLNASELTMDCPTGTKVVNALFKLDNEFIYNGRTNAQMSGSGGYVDTVAKSISIENGQKYRLSVVKVSGSYDGAESDNPDAVYLRAYVLQSGITSVADAIAFCGIDRRKEFIAQSDATAALVFIVYVKGVKLNNLTVKIYLEKVLAEESDEGEDTSIPDYYTDENVALYGDYKNYLNYKIGAINANAENADDSLIFITDYHGVLANRNAGHSPALIKEITKQTGISKLIFGGDAGRTLTYTDYRRWTPAKESAAIYKLLGDSAPDFYGIVGNHEWNERQSLTSGKLVPHDYAYSESAVNQYYLTRDNKPGIVMGTGGCYYFDNTYAKIRYFFLQCTGFAGLSNENCYWFGKQLESVPDGYAVLVFIHLGYLDQACYIEGGVSKDYYSSLTPGTISGIVNLEVKRVSALLDAFQNQSASAMVSTYDNGGESTGMMSFNYGNTNGSVIAVICGHTHRDMVLEKANNPDHVLVIATTTDSYGNNLDYNSSGVLVDRTAGTITEQAFDVVQIDLANKKLYMTRIGGGSDRELSF
jgi:hypothetical protein